MTSCREAGPSPPLAAGACVARGAGFTLFELLVVIAIFGLALVLITGYKMPWSAALNLKATAAELASELRLARSEAIAGNRSVIFSLDLARRSYRLGTGRTHLLPAKISLSLLTIAGEQQGRRKGAIRFNPDGSSTGGRILVAEGGRRIAIGVNWLTGLVSVADVH